MKKFEILLVPIMAVALATGAIHAAPKSAAENAKKSKAASQNAPKPACGAGKYDMDPYGFLNPKDASKGYLLKLVGTNKAIIAGIKEKPGVKTKAVPKNWDVVCVTSRQALDPYEIIDPQDRSKVYVITVLDDEPMVVGIKNKDDGQPEAADGDDSTAEQKPAPKRRRARPQQ